MSDEAKPLTSVAAQREPCLHCIIRLAAADLQRQFGTPGEKIVDSTGQAFAEMIAAILDPRFDAAARRSWFEEKIAHVRQFYDDAERERLLKEMKAAGSA